jgi:hypothetical protein
MYLDFQAGPDATVPRRTHGYNALLEDRHELMVRSVVVLPRPEANLRPSWRSGCWQGASERFRWRRSVG